MKGLVGVEKCGNDFHCVVLNLCCGGVVSKQPKGFGLKERLEEMGCQSGSHRDWIRRLGDRGICVG